MPTLQTQHAPDVDANAAPDTDFQVESASAGFSDPPADTTAEPAPPGAAAHADPTPDEAETAVTVAAETGDDEPEGQADGDHVSAGTSARSKGKAKPTLKERTAELRKQVDQFTFEKRQTQRELDDLRAQIAAHRRELETLAPASARSEKPAPKADVPDPMPVPPDYRKFATDEEYEAALAKWHTEEMPAWQRKEHERLESRLMTGLDERLQTREAERQGDQQASQFVTELHQIASKDPQWDTKREAMGEIRSPWYDPAKHGPATTPFLSDLVQNRREPTLLKYFLDHPERTEALAALLPTRPLRDALVDPDIELEPLLDHFATPEGAQAFEALKRMHPTRLLLAIGALSSQLTTASRGSVVPAAHPITSAHPAVRPPAGTPGVRAGQASATGKSRDFNDWMAEEDEREAAERKRLLGVA